jgi:O-antigen/teichoic acid export membrane protein
MTAAAASRRGDNRELVALARGGGLNFVGAAITQLTTVGLLLYMTRDLSKTDVGLFRISVALFELLMIVALVGLGQAMTRYVAVFRAYRDRAVVLGAIRLGIVVTTVSSVLVGALLFLASPWLSNTLYNEPGLVTPLRFVAFAIPPEPLTPRSPWRRAPASGPCGRTP